MENNKRNLLFFEHATMRGLFDLMDKWQDENQKRLHSTQIQRDGENFCCIALTNPTEVVIVDGFLGRGGPATVRDGKLWVQS